MRIGIDLGGTKIEGIVLQGDKEVARTRIATPRGNYSNILNVIKELIETLEQQVGQKCSVGIGGPGSLNDQGRQRNSNTTEINGQTFIKDLEKLCERTIRFSNDANCFALSEAVCGVAQHAGTVFGVILGTGVGGALIVDKKIITGVNAVGGEWGHNPLPWMTDEERKQARPCYCGKSHCVETFLSGPGFSLTYHAISGENITAEAIIDKVYQQEAPALKAIEILEDQLARGLASVINIFDPEVIVLGGGLSNIERLYTNVPKHWGKYIFSDSVRTQLLAPKGGDSAVVIGAAWLWDAV